MAAKFSCEAYAQYAVPSLLISVNGLSVHTALKTVARETEG